MAIIIPGVNPATNTQNLKTPPRKNVVKLFSAAQQGPSSVVCSFDWAGEYGITNANPVANVLVNLDAGGVIAPIDIIRSVKIDNTGNPSPVYVYFLDTTDTIVAPPDTVVWEPVVTNNRQANVILLGGSNVVGFTKVYFCNFFVPPYVNAEIAQAVDLRLASPQIIFGGLTLGAGQVAQSGQSYTTGTLAVTGGGGGAGATAHGILDTFGRFTGVIVDLNGANYKSPVTLTATAPNAARAAWLRTTSYANGVIVSFNGTEWIRSGAAIIGDGNAPAYNFTSYPPGSEVSRNGQNYVNSSQSFDNVPPSAPWVAVNVSTPDQDGGWTNSGSSGGRAASFSVTMNAGAGEIIQSPAYAPPALGDQWVDYANVNGNAAVLQDNLWGSPYTSGFIYLKAMEFVILFGTGTGTYIVDINEAGGILFRRFEWFMNTSGASAQAGMLAGSNTFVPLSRMGGLNIKLDATKQWRVFYTAGSGQVFLNMSFAFTYSQK